MNTSDTNTGSGEPVIKDGYLLRDGYRLKLATEPTELSEEEQIKLVDIYIEACRMAEEGARQAARVEPAVFRILKKHGPLEIDGAIISPERTVTWRYSKRVRRLERRLAHAQKQAIEDGTASSRLILDLEFIDFRKRGRGKTAARRRAG